MSKISAAAVAEISAPQQFDVSLDHGYLTIKQIVVYNRIDPVTQKMRLAKRSIALLRNWCVPVSNVQGIVAQFFAINPEINPLDCEVAFNIDIQVSGR